MLESLHQEVSNGSQAFDPHALFKWMMANEAEEMRVKIINRAYQGINHEVEKYIWELIDTNRASYQTYKGLLEETVLTEPFDLYEIESEDIDTDKALNGYFKQLSERFHLEKIQWPQAFRDNVARIIDQTMKLIDTIPSPHGAELNAQVFQETQVVAQNQQQQNQQQQQHLQLNQFYNGQRGFKFTREKYGDADRLSDNPMSSLVSSQSQYQYFKFRQKVAVPQLIIHKEYLSPLAGHSSEEFTKPISNLLVQILPDQSYRFLGCTAEGVEFYREEFQRLNSEGKLGAVKYALIGFDRHVLLSTDNLTPQEAQLLTQSTAVAEMTAFTAFLNGEIKDPEALSRLIKDKLKWDYDTYKKILEEIKARHISRHNIQLFSNPLLEIACGWKKAARGITPTAKPSQIQAVGVGPNIPIIPVPTPDRPLQMKRNEVNIPPISPVKAPYKADQQYRLPRSSEEIYPADSIVAPPQPKLPPKAAAKPAAKQVAKPEQKPFFLFRFFGWIFGLLQRLFRSKDSRI